MIQVDLNAPLEIADAEDQVVGYFQNYGVSADSEGKVIEMIEGAVTDGEVNWAEARLHDEGVLQRLSPEILERADDWTVPGIWYRSGRVYFTASD